MEGVYSCVAGIKERLQQAVKQGQCPDCKALHQELLSLATQALKARKRTPNKEPVPKPQNRAFDIRRPKTGLLAENG